MVILWVLTLGLVIHFGMPADSYAKKTYLRFSTAGTGGTYYPMGGAISSLITKKGENINRISNNPINK